MVVVEEEEEKEEGWWGWRLAAGGESNYCHGNMLCRAFTS